jgi:LEA14-like dessication related protein
MKIIVKVLGGLIAFFLLLGALTFLLFKLYPKKMASFLMPDITNVRMNATQSGNGKMHLNIHADISKSIIPELLDSMRYKAVLYKDTITRGTKDFETDSVGSLSIPLTLDYEKLLKIMKTHQGDSSVVRFITRSFVHMPLVGVMKIDYNKDLKFRMIVFPEVKFDKVHVDHFGMNNMVLNVNLKVTNPNNVDIDIPSMKYKMKIDQYLDTKGETTENFHLKANSTSDLSLEMKSDIDKPMKAVWEVLKGKKKWPYKLDSDMVIKPDVKKMDKMNFTTVLDGVLDADEFKK